MQLLSGNTLTSKAVPACLRPTLPVRFVGSPFSARQLRVQSRLREEPSNGQKVALQLAAAFAAAVVVGAAVPEDAFAARSGGRVGGSVRSSANTTAKSTTPERSSRSSTTIVNNYTTYAAPPVFGGWGFGGFSIMPSFVMPIGFGFGGFFQFMLIMVAISAVFSAISAFANRDNERY